MVNILLLQIIGDNRIRVKESCNLIFINLGLPKKETFDFIQTIVKYGRSDIKSKQLFEDSTKPLTAHIMSRY